MDVTTGVALDHLIVALKEDEGYYNKWVSDIANAFQSQYKNYNNCSCAGVDIEEISVNAAKEFMDSLFKQSSNIE